LEAKYSGPTGKEHGDTILSFLSDKGLWSQPIVVNNLLSRSMRRLASDGSPTAIANCTKLFNLSTSPKQSTELLKGFEQAFEGRAMPRLPGDLQLALSNAGYDRLPLDLRMRQTTAFSGTAAWKAIQNQKEKLS